MKRTHKTIIFLIVSLLGAAILLLNFSANQAAPAASQSIPTMPHLVYGLVRVNEIYFVPEGTPVSAWCGGAKVAEDFAVEFEDESWYSLEVPANDPNSPEKDGCVSGEVISFKIAGYEADQTVPWVAESLSYLDLNATSIPPEPHAVSGLVQVNGALIPEGIVISAWCSEVQYAEGIVDAQSQYSLNVPGDDLVTVIKEGCQDGEMIHFMIGSLTAVETQPWQAGQTSTLDLSADSEPPGNYQAFGQVKVNGAFVDAGTPVSAWCDGVQFAQNVTSKDQEGEAWYLLDVPGDDPFTLPKEGCSSGEEIHFMIDYLKADQTAVWDAETSPVDRRVDLSTTSVPPDPYRVFGLARINDEFVEAGTVVSAWCGEVKFIESETSMDGQGQAWYTLDVPGDDPFTAEKEGCGSGETIQFVIGDFEAVQTVDWGTGTSPVRLDLSADSVQPNPYQVYGYARINDKFVEAGTVISAWCDGVQFSASMTTIDGQGESWYTLDVPGDDPLTPEIEGCVAGAIVHFMIGNLEADQTAIWVETESPVRLDLSAEGAIGINFFLPLILK